MAFQACSSYQKISKKTVIAMFDQGSRTRTWLESLTNDQWEITSFNPKSREVCFNVSNKADLLHLSLTLPDLSGKSWSW